MAIEVRGAVQGVGFRPFVYRIAHELSLGGWVVNDPQGVCIEVEGDLVAVERFRERLEADKPAPASIQEFACSWIEPLDQREFTIRRSEQRGAKSAQILPDIATCSDCARELRDPADRRHGYPFTNCTHCGPRLSIVRSLPYDRPRTTMAGFAMCANCLREYENPLDRRFHAQPNACPACGPQVTFWATGDEPSAHGPEAIAAAVAALRGGETVAVKGLGGFHLMVDARSAQAVARLRHNKPRREKPFALMVRDLARARSLCEVDDRAAELLASPESPIVLLRRLPEADVDRGVAPGNPYLGVMLPYTPLHRLLLDALDAPIVATSGNLSDEPICTDEHEARERLDGIADRFLVHDRPIARHVDDSVAWIFEDVPRLLRRARGYAPRPVLLREPAPTLLAVGAHLKNAVALSVERQVFVGQHIGDMETAEAFDAFESVVADFLRLYDASPVAIVHDLHPDYVTTRWAQDVASGARAPQAEHEVFRRLEGLPRIAVQHHHAHLASCLADNGVDGPALGVSWDGTGYGTDGSVWGGEFLLGDAASYRRLAWLRPFRLPGGAAAIREPRRSALALLWETLGEAALERDDLEVVRAFDRGERRLLGGMLARGVNAATTTSAGRLFDGIAALAGLHPTTSFEGQAAMALEYVADEQVADAYPLPLTAGEFLDWKPTVQAVLEDLRHGSPASTISARFHNALAGGVAVVAGRAGVSRVALSGGCFQNRLLTARCCAALRRAGHEVLLQRQLPPNDGGISLGQIAVAAARWSEGL